MTDELRASGPLDDFAARFAATGMLAAKTLAQISLRGDPADARFRDAVRGVIGADVPLEPNTVASADGRAVLWLGPDEWLVAAEGDPAALEAALADALTGQHASAVDVSSSRAVIELAGPHARHVLMKGCGLDLHPRSFAAGRCAQTVLARAQVVIHQLADVPTYRLFVRSSFAAHLAEWLLDAAGEYAT